MKSPTKSARYVAYYRVSTDRQGQSGLGLDAQRKAVMDYLNGGRWDLLGEFVEVESGKRNARPELARALAMCKEKGATLVIARLDRLARNLHFISGLMESGVEFVAVDMPNANRLTVQIMAAVAEDVGRRISQNTEQALAAAKRRGVILGSYAKAWRGKIRPDVRERALAFAPHVAAIRADGHTTVRAITEQLNARGVKSHHGARWHVPAVFRLLRAIDGKTRQRPARRVAKGKPAQVAAA